MYSGYRVHLCFYKHKLGKKCKAYEYIYKLQEMVKDKTVTKDDGDDEENGDKQENVGLDKEPLDEGMTYTEKEEIDKVSKSAEELNNKLVDEDKEHNLLGGLDIESSADIFIPDKLVDQVIGQERARKIVKKAAKQNRHVMMIGSPGTGKSMLSKSMTEMMSKEDLSDILMYPNPDDDNKPKTREVPAGKGKKIIEAHQSEAEQQDSARNFLVIIVIGVILVYSLFTGNFLFGIIAAAVIYFLFNYMSGDAEDNIPNLLIDNSDRKKATFEDATGAHDGALLGDVRHDPFQSGGMETPSHNRVEAGSIHKANNGVLFIDEINTLDVRSQQKLMTAIQEGKFSITGQSERSSGAMVQTEPIPTNFTLVAAGNMDAIENMHPALRDRIEGYGYEVYMDDKIEDTPENRRKFARFVAQEVDRDGEIPHFTPEAVSEIILQAKRKAGEEDKLTLKLRNLGGLIRSSGDIAKDKNSEFVEKEHVLDAKELSQSIEQQYVNQQVEKKKKYGIGGSESGSKVGKVNGLAVMGDDSGIVLPVMGKISESQNSGKIIATGKLQDIAEEAVDNVSAIIKDIGSNLSNKDIHVQFVQTYEGVQGDSASVTVATAVISSIKNIPVKQNVAMTGSLSIRGDVLPVGGVTHKIEAAAKQGIDTVIIPKSNEDDVMIEDEYEGDIEVIPVTHINEVLSIALVDEDKGSYNELIDKISKLANAPKLSELRNPDPS